MSGENKAEISILPSSGITSLRTDGVNWIAVGPDADGQRVDNYLARVAKGVPKSHIYRIIRAGEVRVNKARVKAETKLVEGDLLRVPPIRISQKPAGRPAAVLLKDGSRPVRGQTSSHRQQAFGHCRPRRLGHFARSHRAPARLASRRTLS